MGASECEIRLILIICTSSRNKSKPASQNLTPLSFLWTRFPALSEIPHKKIISATPAHAKNVHFIASTEKKLLGILNYTTLDEKCESICFRFDYYVFYYDYANSVLCLLKVRERFQICFLLWWCSIWWSQISLSHKNSPRQYITWAAPSTSWWWAWSVH